MTHHQPYILAVDPGKTTGLADNFPLPNGNPYSTRVVTTPEELGNAILEYPWDIVLLERFAATTISSHGLYTVRLCGWVEAICWWVPLQLVQRTPQQRLAFQEEAKRYVQAQGKGHVIHEIEALAHLLAYLAAWKKETEGYVLPTEF